MTADMGSAEGRKTITIELTEAEANALYFWTQSNEALDYWTCPLDPVGRALALWYREGGYPGWTSRPEDR